MHEKEWYQSKTIWFNIILFVISVIAVLIDSNTFDQYDELLLISAAVLNLLLRYFFTDSAIR